MLSRRMLPRHFTRRLQTAPSRSPRSTPPPSREKPSASSAGNPGVKLSQFQALFDAPPPNYRPRRYRWDWHLRMFLTAMIPPTCLYIVLTGVDYAIGGDVALKEKMLTALETDNSDERKEENEIAVQGNSERGTTLQIVERRIEVLEEELRRMKECREGEPVVQKARLAAQVLRRQTGEGVVGIEANEVPR